MVNYRMACELLKPRQNKAEPSLDSTLHIPGLRKGVYTSTNHYETLHVVGVTMFI